MWWNLWENVWDIWCSVLSSLSIHSAPLRLHCLNVWLCCSLTLLIFNTSVLSKKRMQPICIKFCPWPATAALMPISGAVLTPLLLAFFFFFFFFSKGTGVFWGYIHSSHLCSRQICYTTSDSHSVRDQVFSQYNVTNLHTDANCCSGKGVKFCLEMESGFLLSVLKNNPTETNKKNPIDWPPNGIILQHTAAKSQREP